MKHLFIITSILIGMISVKAQVSTISLRASGLTCSMCSNAINKSLRTLDFIDSIEADIKTYTFIIYCRPGSEVGFGSIKKKVEDAGFSVASFTALISFDNIYITVEQPVIIGKNKMIFVGTKPEKLDGKMQVKLLDKGFVSSKEYKSPRLAVPAEGTYHFTI